MGTKAAGENQAGDGAMTVHSIHVWESLDDLQELLNRMVNKGWAASWHHVEGDRGWTIFVREETK